MGWFDKNDKTLKLTRQTLGELGRTKKKLNGEQLEMAAQALITMGSKLEHPGPLLKSSTSSHNRWRALEMDAPAVVLDDQRGTISAHEFAMITSNIDASTRQSSTAAMVVLGLLSNEEKEIRSLIDQASRLTFVAELHASQWVSTNLGVEYCLPEDFDFRGDPKQMIKNFGENLKRGDKGLTPTTPLQAATYLLSMAASFYLNSDQSEKAAKCALAATTLGRTQRGLTTTYAFKLLALGIALNKLSVKLSPSPSRMVQSSLLREPLFA